MFDLWKLQDYASGEGVAHNVFTEQFETSDWIDIGARTIIVTNRSIRLTPEMVSVDWHEVG